MQITRIDHIVLTVADIAATKAAYEQFAAAVITTTRLVLQVEEFQQAKHVALPVPVMSALELYWRSFSRRSMSPCLFLS